MSEYTKDIADEGRYDLEARCAHAETRMKQLEGMLRESENALQRALGRYDALKMDFVALKKEVLPTTLREQVIEFHKAMHFPGTGEDLVVPKIPSDERVRLRASLIAEEFFETLMAMFTPQNSESVDAFDAARAAFNAARATIMVGMIGSASVRVHMSELADGLCDLAYVIEGTHLELGIDSSPLAAEVHRANMAKVGGPLSATGKQLKPEGWTPPDIEGELRKQGWKEEGKR